MDEITVYKTGTQCSDEEHKERVKKLAESMMETIDNKRDSEAMRSFSYDDVKEKRKKK